MDRNTVTRTDVAEPEGDLVMPQMTSEALIRWGATAGFLVCVGAFMWALGASVGAWAAWLAGIVALGACMFPLWGHHLRENGIREARAEYNAGAGAFTAHDDDTRPVGGTSLTAGPGRDDRGDDPDEGRAVPPWQDSGTTYP